MSSLHIIVYDNIEPIIFSIISRYHLSANRVELSVQFFMIDEQTILFNGGLNKISIAEDLSKKLNAKIVIYEEEDNKKLSNKSSNDSTRVVNVRVNHIRPEYNDLKDWMNNPLNVYGGRGRVVYVNRRRFPEKDSWLANPFKVDKDGNLENVLTKFETYFRRRISDGNITTSDLAGLVGKTLGCWCVSGPVTFTKDRTKWICHLQVVLSILEELKHTKHFNEVCDTLVEEKYPAHIETPLKFMDRLCEWSCADKTKKCISRVCAYKDKEGNKHEPEPFTCDGKAIFNDIDYSGKYLCKTHYDTITNKLEINR